MRLMIECCRTGHLIPTGIDTDERSFEMLSIVTAKTYCAYCRRYHLWSKEDVCFDNFAAVAIRH
jgi:hypothetical protein